MPRATNTRANKERIKQAKAMYLAGNTDSANLAAIFNVSERTILRWIASYGWATEKSEEQQLEAEIDKAVKKALLEALRNYKDNPGEVALQSLTSLLKQYMQKNKPAKELNEYILLFVEQVVDYALDNDLESLREIWQENLVKIAEYLRAKNG